MDSIFQSYIEYLPKEPVLDRYERIDSIFKNKEKPNRVLHPIHYGAYREEIKELWGERGLNIGEILLEIDSLELRKHSVFHKPNKGSYFLGRLGGNYCSIEQDIADKQIKHFQFGIDITKRETKIFVERILDIATRNKFILLGSNLDTFEPTVKKIDSYFRNSPAYKMIKTEEEFTERVKNGLEKTDVPFITLRK